jgi:aspartyl-tRNA(Asn)/glutamyl-tRNA(Gln) amidotransferase subunit B
MRATEYEAVIGLEVHAQLLTRTKMFCGCRTDFGHAANSQVCPVCLGLPGALPVVNAAAVRLATVAAAALGATVGEESIFARKNYFYPDLPKGYQISQYERPFARGGCVRVRDRGEEVAVPIERINLEEDAGKSVHAGPGQGTGIDFNRCGIPLLEIVSAPEISSPGLAHRYLARLKQILEYAGVSSGDMELGALRCDANVSIRPSGARALGTKTEIKNLNSFRSVERGLEYEIGRQTELARAGRPVKHETLLWDSQRQVSVLMRSKEKVDDYRYFPEPDLVRFRIAPLYLESLRPLLPELPHERERRFIEKDGLPEYDAGALVSTRALADYYEETARLGGDPKAASNWILTEVLKVLNEKGIEIEQFGVAPKDLADLLALVREGRISGKIAKQVFEQIVETGETAGSIVRRGGLAQIVDEQELLRIARAVIAENPSSVRDYQNGKARAFRFLVGKVMEATGGKANPEMTSTILDRELKT